MGELLGWIQPLGREPASFSRFQKWNDCAYRKRGQSPPSCCRYYLHKLRIIRAYAQKSIYPDLRHHPFKLWNVSHFYHPRNQPMQDSFLFAHFLIARFLYAALPTHFYLRFAEDWQVVWQPAPLGQKLIYGVTPVTYN